MRLAQAAGTRNVRLSDLLLTCGLAPESLARGLASLLLTFVLAAGIERSRDRHV